MIKNYFLIALRNLRRQRGYTALNVVGLAVGVSGCLLLILAIQFEWKFDRHHPELSRLYRVQQTNFDGNRYPNVGPLMGEMLGQDFEGVEAYARVTDNSNMLVANEAARPARRFNEVEIRFADPAVLDLLGLPFVAGDPAAALNGVNQVVLTEAAAARYFPGGAALGQTLLLEGKTTVEVTGVLRDPPPTSEIQFNLLMPIALQKQLWGIKEFDSWWWPTYSTFVRLQPTTDVAGLEAQMPEWIKQYREADLAAVLIPQFQPVAEMRLRGNGNDGEGTARFVTTFALIAACVLLLATFNFINLTTARATRRAREVGVRKSLGAVRGQLVGQFLSESVLLAAVSVALGVLLAEALLPWFSQTTGQTLRLDLGDPLLLGGLVALLLVIGVLAGSYPALLLSHFRPARVLKGTMPKSAGGGRLRQVLVVGQFAVSVALVVGAAVAYQQLRYLQEKSLGFDTEQVVLIDTHGAREVSSGYQAFKQTLEQQSDVRGVTAANWLPGAEWQVSFPARVQDEYVEAAGILYVDYDFFDVMGLPLTQGRAFSDQFPADGAGAFIINEQVVEQLKLENPLDQTAWIGYGENGKMLFEREGNIVGVAADFHAQNLRMGIRPTFITIEPNYATTGRSGQMQYLYVKLAPGAVQPTLAAVERTWREHFPTRPFEARLVDERLRSVYEVEQQFGRTVGFFAALAVLVACLGLFGLSSYTIEQRVQEIGVRKVLGASVRDVVVLLNREFTLLVVGGIVLGVPVAWWAMHRWLADFPYRIEVGAGLLLLSGAAALLVAWLTVSWQSLRAARMNPVDALRSE
ncbi:MAG: ABC transporter permease [Catalinimonas sp.]